MTKITDQIKALATLKTQTLELERTIAAELQSSFASLPAQYGFDSVASFAAAVHEAAETGGNH